MKAPQKCNDVPSVVKMAFEYRNKIGSQCNWIFEVDYSINSMHPRLFVYSISEKLLYTYKCAHGSGGDNKKPHDGNAREFSNIDKSFCSSLGYIKTLKRYTSDVVGEALKLKGLSDTNSNILKRGVVLHGSEYVFDNDSSNDFSLSGRSKGCIAVDDKYIDKASGGKLIDILENGSIGCAHYNGKININHV